MRGALVWTLAAMCVLAAAQEEDPILLQTLYDRSTKYQGRAASDGALYEGQPNYWNCPNLNRGPGTVRACCMCRVILAGPGAPRTPPWIRPSFINELKIEKKSVRFFTTHHNFNLPWA